MLDSKHLDDLVDRFCSALPPAVKDFKNDIEENFKSAVKGAFAKMDLVSREEFDAQVKVLERTREKLEALEKQFKASSAKPKATAAAAKSSKAKKPKSQD